MNELNEERYQDTHSKDKSEEIKQITNDSKRISYEPEFSVSKLIPMVWS